MKEGDNPGESHRLPSQKGSTSVSIMLLKPSKLYIAGSVVSGTVNVYSPDPVDRRNVSLFFCGEAIAYYFTSKYRKEAYANETIDLAETQTSLVPLSNGDILPGSHPFPHDANSGDQSLNEERVPCRPTHGKGRISNAKRASLAKVLVFKFKIPQKLPSSFEGDVYGHLRYVLRCEVITDDPSPVIVEEELYVYEHFVTVCDRFSLNIKNDDSDEQQMSLSLTIDRPGFIPRETLGFSCEVTNLGKKPIKKMVALLLQNVSFCRSAQHKLGRIKSFIMAAREEAAIVKEGENKTWVADLTIPDPLPPTSNTNKSLIKIYYELILVAVTKGRSSDLLKVYDEARYHYDIQCNRDECFRDFLPSVSVEVHIGSSNERGRVSGYMTGESAKLPTMNETVFMNTSGRGKLCI